MYCEYERQFAAGSRLAATEQQRAISQLDATIAEWNVVKAEYAKASFERREALCDVREELRSQLASYLDVRAKRKALQAACRKGDSRISKRFAEVCEELGWSADLSRALRLG